MFLYECYGGLQIKQRSTAAGTGDELSLACAYTCCLQDPERIGIKIGNVNFPFVAQHHPIAKSV
ncbi:hypothetical protein SDC9_159544 [bioreactor metagenome]|uniref:Uncharacterized protein n=1 Tax=bioreactor metagenome TaxID=1076179 RepID=A0A645FFG9_9ZZZZ